MSQQSVYQFVIDLLMVKGDDRRTHRLKIQCSNDSARDDTVEQYVEAKFKQGWVCQEIHLVTATPLN